MERGAKEEGENAATYWCRCQEKPGTADNCQSFLPSFVVVSAFAFIGSYILLVVTNAISPLRVSAEDEEIGLDMSQHDEEL